MVKTIGLEEHFVTADVLQSWSQLEAQWQNPAGLSAGDDIGRRLADLADERLAAMEDPDAALFSQLRGAAQRAQSDPIVQALQLQYVARGKLQFVPHHLGEHDSTDLIHRQFGSHRDHYMLGFGNNKCHTLLGQFKWRHARDCPECGRTATR